ncbi:MAG: DUF6364 family protein [Acidobacteriota bacterium]|nr:DUF6364 family protein [Acidobacteriota bacterium]
MKLNLSIDEGLVQRAWKVAEDRGTSLNQIIREYLEVLTGAPAGEVKQETRRPSSSGRRAPLRKVGAAAGKAERSRRG